jgi:hypothetical protein
MKDLFYENCVLRNTNYYLLCTLYHLEKQKIEHLDKCIKQTETETETDKHEVIKEEDLNPNKKELLDILKEKEDEYLLLKTELQNLKIEMEIQKEFATHKIHNLESVKQALEEEMKIQSPEIIKKEIEIDKLKRENIMLSINNQQLQFELIRSIKLRE